MPRRGHRARRRGPWIVVGVLLAMGASYVFGLYSYLRDLWPIELTRDATHLTSVTPLRAGTYTHFGRLAGYPGKTEVPCPAANDDTAIILAMGQSNAANHASARIDSRTGDAVVNLYDGKCYRAGSPLLGSTAEQGEFLTPMADKLVADGAYRKVVLVPAAVGATPIGRWRKGGDLNSMVRDVLDDLPDGYKPTQIVWFQGESDLLDLTPGDAYGEAFASLLETLPEGVPVFIAIATRCYGIWRADNAIAQAQRASIDNQRVFLGADIDGLLTDNDRQPDRCHLAEAGQMKAANAFADAIARQRKGR